MTWAIMPPIDTPTTCAPAHPSASNTASPSVAMSASVYFAVTREDRPASRLSNRATWNPRSTSAAQKSSDQPSIGARPPWMSSSGRPSEPNVS